MDFTLGTYAVGFMAGVLTILSPCALPLVPILVASALAAHRIDYIAIGSTGQADESYCACSLQALAGEHHFGSAKRWPRLDDGLLAGYRVLRQRDQHGDPPEDLPEDLVEGPGSLVIGHPFTERIREIPLAEFGLAGE